jgi:hypothetical protein
VLLIEVDLSAKISFAADDDDEKKNTTTTTKNVTKPIEYKNLKTLRLYLIT